jgi:hypothetical protein
MTHREGPLPVSERIATLEHRARFGSARHPDHEHAGLRQLVAFGAIFE